MKEAVERIVKSLADREDAVDVSAFSDGKNVRIEVRVDESDMGRLIGREGRTIKSLRSLLFFAGQKHGRRYHLDVIED